ncbi:MAG: diaminopimelate decarboxylase [Candidatus Margulisiibacteriota bacterium]
MINLPLTAKINSRGHLEIGGCDVVDLAKEFGTPLYVLDEKTIRDRCQQYLKSFRSHYPNTEIIYASKALCTIGTSEIIASEGLGFDVSSGGELYTVLKAKVDPKKIYFHGNNKSLSEIRDGILAAVGCFVVDSEQELENLEKIAEEVKRKVKILLRINPGIEAHTHEFIQTGKIDSKFGIPLEQVDSFVEKIRKLKRMELMGFHAHIGSQILEIKPFIAEVQLLLELTKRYGLQEINMGGGLGIAYLPQHTPPSIEHLAKEVTAVLKGQTMAKLVLEPGRSIVGTAGVTLYTIGGIKEIPGIRKYIFVDGGMADNPRPMLYGAKYSACLGNKQQEEEETVTVAGRFCESGDILLKDIKLPKVEVGDTLVVAGTGAYNYSMASNYNRVGRPAMVLVNEGRAAVVVKRESYEDLIRNDTH